jgi:hypothetical protein
MWFYLSFVRRANREQQCLKVLSRVRFFQLRRDRSTSSYSISAALGAMKRWISDRRCQSSFDFD